MGARFVRFAMLVFGSVASVTVSSVGAQQSPGDTVVVKTIALQFLSNADAAKLAAPYIPNGYTRAGVFEAGNAVHAITVTAPARVIVRIDSLLKANDRAPVMVTLRLQVIAASDSAVHDASITELDAELHNLFRFNGYRLLSQNTVSVNSRSMFSATMRGPGGDQLTVSGDLNGVQGEGAKSVQVYISLSHNARQTEMVAGAVQTGMIPQQLLRTGLTIPIGQTVVVGSAMTGGSTPAIILTVKPELSPKP